MFELFDEDLDNMELVEGALALNKAIDPDTDVSWAEQELARLLKEAELCLANEVSEEQRFESFLRLFYQEWGFSGDNEAYFSSDNAFIDKVLERRKGIPLSLGSLVLYLGRHLGFPVEGVAFPSQFLLKVCWQHKERPCYINPYDGEYVAEHILRAWLIGLEGPLAKLEPKHLKSADHPTLIGRWLAIIKSALLREEHYTLALKCTDLALTFVPDDPYEIRDRGFIYQQLDCFQVAKSDYQFFIEQCPDDPAAKLLKLQVNALNETPITIH
jgi:regulator of sirC expression with transglutaminase-like and TPR domain